MNQTKLNEVLKLHKKWLYNESGGKKANLHGADLRETDLYGADLRLANLCEADLRGVNLREANLYGANLHGANLYGADLRGADLYQSMLPLWCGGLILQLDRLQMAQLAYHFCSMRCDDEEVKALQRSLYKYANEFADSRDGLKKFEDDEYE